MAVAVCLVLQIDFGSEISKDHFNTYTFIIFLVMLIENDVLFILLFNQIYLNFVNPI